MDWIALVARLLLAAVFLVAAVGKLTDARGSRQALEDFGVPSGLTAPLGLALPLVELGIAALLLFGASARWGAVAALGLLGLFTLGIVGTLVRGRRPDCHCFGQLHSAPVGWSTVGRNGALAAIAAVVLGWGGRSSEITGLGGVGLGVATGVALGTAVLGLGVALIEGWLLLNMLRQQGRLLLRLERAEKVLHLAEGSGLLVGESAPDFELPTLDGDRLSLASLRLAGRPVLLFFMDPRCGPCELVLPDVARWQREHVGRVTIAAISDGTPEANRAKVEQHDLRRLLLDDDQEVKRAYDINATPAAVLIGADGTIAGRNAYFVVGVEGLLQQALTGVPYDPQADALRPTPASGGDGQPPPSEPHAPAPPLGQPAPAFMLPDLDGRTTALGDFAGTATLVLFWSPTCGYCRQMLPELMKWERRRPVGSPELLLVSSGTVEANRTMGLSSRIVLDEAGATMRAFGATGTPMAVLVDGDGRIASRLVVGAQEVMALARTRRREREAAVG
ncbi:MAG TPA: redoxin domain-containing protein [Gemmatimonadales bacterium]|nr:redoxin domain-containing protein [Gemmatimonadales bacterium]